MRMTAIDRGKRPADYLETSTAPASELTEMQKLVRDAAQQCGSLHALARRIDISLAAPGNWARGMHSPSRKYVERMRAIVEGEG